MTKCDEQLFAKAMQDVRPLKKKDKFLKKTCQSISPGQVYRRLAAESTEQELAGPFSLFLKHPLNPDDWLMFKRNGIQEGVYKKLRLGKYPLEATLNIQHKQPEQARDELQEFIQDCQRCNLRSFIISFGKGHPACIRLKGYLAQWLRAVPEVQAYHTAQKQHGGIAAVYVLFRKSDQQRRQNSERHAARQAR